jgi:L-rhamnose mutarotase
MFLLNTDAGEPEDFDDLTLPELELKIPSAVIHYRRLHRKMPLEVREALAAHNVRNYSVYVGYAEPEYYGVRYYEYVGLNYVLDMAELDRDEAYRTWRADCERYEVPLIGAAVNPWEAAMDEVFHAELTPGSLRTAREMEGGEERP